LEGLRRNRERWIGDGGNKDVDVDISKHFLGPNSTLYAIIKAGDELE
jgi:hypothetical protein